MYKTILVPLDGSKRAEAIMPYVESLAKSYESEVILMQVVEPRPYVVQPDSIYPLFDQQDLERRTQEAKDYLASREEKLRRKGIPCRAQVAHGPIVEEIINVAEHERADLIAMVSHGRTGLSRVFYGSVAAGVLNRVDRPLLLIRSLGG